MNLPRRFLVLVAVASLSFLAPAPTQAADVTITAANFIPSTNAQRSQGVAGATIAQGDCLYLDSATNTLKLADANGAGDLHNFVGIAENGGASGQMISYITKDPSLTIGGTVAAGAILILSATPAKMAPSTDNITGWYVTVLGPGIGSNKINFSPVAAGVATP